MKKRYIIPATEITETISSTLIAASLPQGGEIEDGEANSRSYGWQVADWEKTEE